jgi:hypothetical protein
MKIVRFHKRNAIRFDQEWRSALRELDGGRPVGSRELSSWYDRAKAGLQFAHDGGTASGSIHFDEDDTVLHPSELCEQLGLDSVWFFARDFTWAVHAGHEDWDIAKVFEVPDSPFT